MQGKYRNPLKYYAARARRSPLRWVLRTNASWEPMAAPKDGYTIFLGNYSPLSEILLANFKLLRLQDLTHLDKIVVVSDRPKELLPVPIEEMARKEFPELPLEFLYYGPVEWKLYKAIGWAYTYWWKSCVKAVAAARTKFVLIHDMDAMLLRRDIIEERYKCIRDGGHTYVGVRAYHGNGVLKEDNLVTTWEMMFDAEFVRRRFHPVDLFCDVTKYKGRTVDFDGFLSAQAREGRNFVLPVADEDMVHPSQVITQYTYLVESPGYVPPEHNNLFMIPYFYALADRTGEMEKMTAEMAGAGGSSVVHLFGKGMDCRKVSVVHARWLESQAAVLERAVYGEVRPVVARYFEQIVRLAERNEGAKVPVEAPPGAVAAVA